MCFLIVFDRTNESAPVACVVVPFNVSQLMREATPASVYYQPGGGTRALENGRCCAMGAELRLVRLLFSLSKQRDGLLTCESDFLFHRMNDSKRTCESGGSEWVRSSSSLWTRTVSGSDKVRAAHT